MKRSLIFGTIILLMAALIIGCPDPVNSSTPDPTPDPIDDQTTELKPSSGTTLTAAEFKSALSATSTHHEIKTDISVDAIDTFTVPAEKKIKFTGNLTLKSGSLIRFESKSSIEGSGKIKGDATTAKVVIVGEGLSNDIKGDNAELALLLTGTALPGDYIGVVGDVTIGAEATAPGTAAKILNTELTATKSLYVFGNVTISANVTVNALNVYSTSADNGNITASGAATLSAASLSAKNVTLGTGTLSVTGAATITGILTGGGVTFGGATTIGTFTPGAVDTTIAGAGAVTITTLGATATNTVKITNTGGVTLNSETTIAANLKVTKVKITGVATGVVIKSDAASITVPASASIATTTDTGSQIVAGGTDNKVTLTKATLGPGTYTAGTADLTLGASTTVEVASGGVVEIAEGATLKVTNNTSLLKVLAGGAVDVKKTESGSGGSIIKAGTDGNETGVTFVAKTAPDTAAQWAITAGSGNDASNFTVAAASSGNTGEAILGKIKFAGNDSDTNPKAGAGAGATAAAGKLTAGASTIFIISASA